MSGQEAYRAQREPRRTFHALPRGVHRMVAASEGAVLLESSRGGRGEARSYLFRDPVRVAEVRELGEIPELFRAVETAGREGLYAAGYLGYECGYHFEPTALPAGERVGGGGLPLAWFGFYREPLIFDHETGTFNRAEAVPEESAGPETGCVAEMEITEAKYAGQVERIKRLIERGETYQVNLTTRVRLRWKGDEAALFGQMMRAQPVEFGAYLKLGGGAILSASPELFFDSREGLMQGQGREIEVRPMKGTASRGRDMEEDVERARWLAGDEKNRSENVMIVDLLRSDLGRVCAMGTIEAEEMFKVERYPTVLQMVSTVRGVLREEVGYRELFRALFPSGSIVGAPKIRTMGIVRELEGRDRGVYTGSIGLIAPGGRATFSVAIRTVTIEGERAEMGVGSGVVYDSDAAAEFEECRGKARFLDRDTESFRLIETLLWDGEYAFAEEHLGRMERSAEFFDFGVDGRRLREMLEREASGLVAGRCYRVRLLLNGAGAVEVSSCEIERGGAAGCVVELGEGRVWSGDVFLRHKTTRRAPYDRAYGEAERRGHADVIFRNERGEITEGAIHNVLVVKDGCWRTPPLTAGVLPGVFRAHLMASRGVLEGTITVAELLAADEVYLCNSVRGLRRVDGIVGG